MRESIWSSAESLQAISSWALIVALIAGIITAVSGAVGTVAGNKANNLNAREASVRIAEANEKAAKANEEAERLRLAVEHERMERLKLEEKVQPRRISADQVSLIKASLAHAPKGKVYINPDWMDPEAKLFAAQIASILEPLGYAVEKLTGDEAPISYGKLGAMLIVRDGNQQPPHLAPLYSAFKKAGIVFDLHAEPYVPDTASVLIGVSTH